MSNLAEAEAQELHDQSIRDLEVVSLRKQLEEARCVACRFEEENKNLRQEMLDLRDSYHIQVSRIIRGKPRPWKALAIYALGCMAFSLLIGICVQNELMVVQLGEPVAMSALVACAVLGGIAVERIYWNRRWIVESKRGAWK